MAEYRFRIVDVNNTEHCSVWEELSDEQRGQIEIVLENMSTLNFVKVLNVGGVTTYLNPRNIVSAELLERK